jgi:HD-GYP domain-containing protein (c-di-GMP phosphodiesterase class II)
VVYGELALRELGDWDWGTRLANASVQRLEFQRGTSRDEYELFLEEVLARLTLQAIDSSTRSPEKRSTIKFGAIGVKGSDEQVRAIVTQVPTATITYQLGEEAETVRWMHHEVQNTGGLPLAEAETVVRSLSLAMHGDRNVVLPLVQLKEFDQYTTTHSLNVSVLTMALAEWLGLGPTDVRAFGVAGLLHDLGRCGSQRTC